MRMAIKSLSAYRKELTLSDKYLFPIGLPLLLALLLGVVQAYLINSEAWIFILIIPFLIPVGILFLRYPFVALILWMMILPFFPPKDNMRHLYWIFHRGMIPATLGLIILARMFRLK